MRVGFMLAVVTLGLGPASQAQPGPPLPPLRPKDVASPVPAPATAPEPRQAVSTEVGPAPPSEAASCLAHLKAAGFDVEAAEPPSHSNERCRIEVPVRLKAVPVSARPGAMVRLSDQPLLACRFADPFGRWVGELVAPVVAGVHKTDLTNVRTGRGFECRNRNGAATGKLSAHAEGLAIDISGFELANGSTLRIKPEGDGSPDLALAALRTAACGWFTTVLGPGSDAAHGDHLHVDVQRHGSSDRYRICQ